MTNTYLIMKKIERNIPNDIHTSEKVDTNKQDSKIKFAYSEIEKNINLQNKENIDIINNKLNISFNKSFSKITALLVDKAIETNVIDKESIKDSTVKYQLLIHTLPFALILNIIGCSNSYDQFEGCNDDQEEFIRKSIEFLKDNRSDIRKMMNKMGMKKTVNINQLLKILEDIDSGNNVKIICKDMSNEKNKKYTVADIDTSLNPPLIRFNSAEDKALNSYLAIYNIFEKYNNFSEEEVMKSNLDIHYQQDGVNTKNLKVNEFNTYTKSIGYIASTLLHELAHEVIDVDHNENTEKKALTNEKDEKKKSIERYWIDEVYAWGETVNLFVLEKNLERKLDYERRLIDEADEFFKKLEDEDTGNFEDTGDQ